MSIYGVKGEGLFKLKVFLSQEKAVLINGPGLFCKYKSVHPNLYPSVGFKYLKIFSTAAFGENRSIAIALVAASCKNFRSLKYLRYY